MFTWRSPRREGDGCWIGRERELVSDKLIQDSWQEALKPFLNCFKRLAKSLSGCQCAILPVWTEIGQCAGPSDLLKGFPIISLMMSRSTGSKLTTATGESKAAMLESSRGTDSTSYSDAERWVIILTCNHFCLHLRFEEHLDRDLSPGGRRNAKRWDEISLQIL